MVKILVSSGLLASVFFHATAGAQAAESKQDKAVCEMVVESATAAAGYGIARMNRLGELGRTLATALGDKIGSKFITRYVCGTDDEKTGVASPPAPSSVIPPLSPGYAAPGEFGLGHKSDSALGRGCLTLQCLGIASPDLQRALDDFRKEVHSSLGASALALSPLAPPSSAANARALPGLTGLTPGEDPCLQHLAGCSQIYAPPLEGQQIPPTSRGYEASSSASAPRPTPDPAPRQRPGTPVFDGSKYLLEQPPLRDDGICFTSRQPDGSCLSGRRSDLPPLTSIYRSGAGK